jgi:RNA-binding protein 5/10
MIRGLAQHISENDIRQDIIHCGLMPKDIRLIRKKDTGTYFRLAFSITCPWAVFVHISS